MVYTTEANLFFQSWAKDVQAIVIDRQMSDNEALQLIKEHTEGTAHRQVDNYLDFSDNQNIFRINEKSCQLHLSHARMKHH